MELPPLLDSLLRAEGPSGYEEPASAIWREAASFAELSCDRIGSSIARVGDRGPLLAVVGHIDEIGFVVNHVDERGFLWFNPIGYWDPNILVGQRVAIRGERGDTVLGVVGRRPKSLDVLSGDEQLGKPLLLRELHIDIGAGDRAEANARVRVGDSGVIAAEPAQLTADRVVSRAMDNRLGAYIALEGLRRCVDAGGPAGSFAAVASVQEELGLRGAQTAVHQLRPDVAIAVDVFFSSDAPTIEERDVGEHELGSGAIIGRGPTLSPKVSRLLIETAESEGIPYTLGGYGLAGLGLSTGTDADAMQISREGVATGVVSIPLRYMHSPVEMVDLRDLEACVALIAAFGRRLDTGVDLQR
jgi:endoglucanase